ncbi:hypothetical protein DY000_02046757 [Brassica cretica]|uniref:Uncharacterized protein n=1 Tax=Brassica cretica TaxID=69181 RepID=A0ABQ7F553_BRACR|nr:hypothetical protein DY000_02046757 [Brassica cretica]
MDDLLKRPKLNLNARRFATLLMATNSGGKADVDTTCSGSGNVQWLRQRAVAPATSMISRKREVRSSWPDLLPELDSRRSGYASGKRWLSKHCLGRLLTPANGCSRPRSASAQGVPDPSSDVRDPRAAPTRDLFLVRDSIRQLASDDQGVPDQATKDVRDPIEATRSIPARAPFLSRSWLKSFGGPIQQSSKVKR